MSRCFPFPPPGYEKKPLTDDLDLLKKEKRKEKKHKKDKKDKDKKEGKEKREKDRSEGKYKDKKDKKDKHRDKKKDKDKAKTTQDEGYNGHNNTEQIQDKKHLLQFRNGESNKDHRPSSSSDDKKQPQFQGQNGDLARNRDSENYKFVQELDRRIRDEEKGSGSHQFFVEGRKISYNNNKHDMQNAAARNKINGATPPPPPPPPSQPPPPPPQPPLPPPQPPLDNRRLESNERRGDKRKHKDRDKQRAGKEKDKLKEKSEREKNKHIRKSDILENSEGVLKKRKEMETNGVLSSHENEARPNKMARPISNISPQNQNPSSSFLDNQKASSHSQNNFKTGTKSQKVNGMNSMSSPPFSLPAKKPPVPASNHIQHKPSPIKSPPPPSLPIPPPVITNTNHVAAQSPPLITTKPPPPPPQLQPPIPVSNSIPVAPPAKQPVSRPKPPPAVIKAAPVAAPPPRKKVEPVKPPHPDTKYLSQILSVPKPEEWGGVDEQEWLFEGAVAAPRRERAAEMAEVQVWSEAKQIESVDVCALPYVIPY